MSNKKNILITGGAGFIGTNLAEELIKVGHAVTSIDDYSFGKKENEIAKVKYINDDIENINIIKKPIDICFHLAAKARVQPSFENPTDYFRVNVKGTMSVMEWARRNGVKVVYAGSSSRHFHPEDSPYAMYKYLGEQICKLYKKTYGLKVEIARFYNVYGPRESRDEKYGNVIGIWTSKSIKGEKLPIVGDGKQRRDFTHVYDIVDGLIKIGLSEKSEEDGWELGTGNNYSVNELFEMFSDRFNVSSKYVPDQPGNYKKTLRKNNRLIDLLGWSPKDRLSEHIKTLKI
ncbi:MAG: NAD-dependent epimerase/dehydratase family protein [Bacteroidota bacterium]|nr:NAD-dependent epimerase/dehydratase family protein [Bacteroidota bacterium]